jgi:hypothetical protein
MNFELLKASLVPCGLGPAADSGFKACTVCDFFVLAQNIINFFLYLTIPLVTLAAVYIAFIFMTSGGSSSKITDAKSKLWLVILGIFWVLGSWLVLNTILNIVAKPSVFPWPWNRIECTASQPPVNTTGSPSVGVAVGSSNQSFDAVGGSSGGGGADRLIPLSEQQARSALQQAGITVNKGACPDGVSYQNVSGGCTSVEGIKDSTVAKVIALKQACNCVIEITGGTELGHAQGTVSHTSGDKVDLQPNSALDNYIQNNFNYIGFRSDGAKQYKTAYGTVFAQEGTHWDIAFAK